MKTIKFDLKLKNGEITLRTLDDLEENLSPELFTHFHSGKLAKWLRVRKLDELAEKMEALRAQHLEDKNELDVKLFKNLCEIFVSEVSEEDAREAMQDYQLVTFEQNSNDEEIESLKGEIEQLKIENEMLKAKGEEVEEFKAENEKLKAKIDKENSVFGVSREEINSLWGLSERDRRAKLDELKEKVKFRSLSEAIKIKTY